MASHLYESCKALMLESTVKLRMHLSNSLIKAGYNSKLFSQQWLSLFYLMLIRKPVNRCSEILMNA